MEEMESSCSSVALFLLMSDRDINMLKMKVCSSLMLCRVASKLIEFLDSAQMTAIDMREVLK